MGLGPEESCVCIWRVCHRKFSVVTVLSPSSHGWTTSAQNASNAIFPQISLFIPHQVSPENPVCNITSFSFSSCNLFPTGDKQLCWEHLIRLAFTCALHITLVFGRPTLSHAVSNHNRAHDMGPAKKIKIKWTNEQTFMDYSASLVACMTTLVLQETWICWGRNLWQWAVIPCCTARRDTEKLTVAENSFSQTAS